MTKEKIISLINNRIEELSVPYQKDDDFNFFQDFVEKNSVRQASDFLNIEIVKFLQGLFYLEINREKDKDEVIGIKECKNIINSILSFVKNLSINSLDILGIDFYYYYKDKELSKIIKYVEEKDKDKEEQILKSIYSDNEKKQSTVKDIKKIINNNSKGCFTYLKVMNDYPLEIMSVMSFFKGYRLMLQIEKEYNSVIRKLDYKIKKKDYDKCLNGSIKLNLDKNVILNSFNLFIKKADDLKREERQFEKARLKELKYYQSNSLIESINDILTLDEITNASDIVKSIKNEEIKKAVLTLIYEHNMKYYKNLKKEYLKLAKNDKSKYIALLNDYDLPTDEKFIEKIRYISIEEMKNILKIIFKYNLNKITLIQILTNNTALVNVLEINEYYELGIIDLKFIKQNLDILEKDSEKFRILSDNIKLIRNYTINPVLLKNNSSLFFESSELLKNNLDILSTYNLIKAFKTTADFAFLTSSNLNVKIDKMLELGFESFLEKDLSVLKSDNIKRLSLVKPLFIEFTSINDLKEFLEDEFYVKDELIDNYVESFYNYKEKKEYGVNIEILEDFKYTRRTYNINGVIISKNKVEKLVSEGFDLYDALFKNMNISEDEYNLVVCELDKKVFQKKYV